MRAKIATAAIALYTSSTLFGYQDLGTYGGQYDVKEKDIKEVIKKSLVESKDKIKEMAEKAFESGLIYHSDIPFSDKNETKIATAAFNDPKTNKTFPLSNIPQTIHDSLCVISFESFNILDEVISEFGDSCRYVFLNVDIRKITSLKKYANIEPYIGNDLLFQIFNIEATPVKLTIDKEKIKYEYLDYKKVKATAKEKLLEGKL